MKDKTIMQLDNHTKLKVDAHNYIIAEEGKNTKTKEWTGNYKSVSFYGTISAVLNAYAKKRHKSAVLNRSIDTLSALQTIFKDIEVIGQGLDVKIKSIASHRGYTNKDFVELIKKERGETK